MMSTDKLENDQFNEILNVGLTMDQRRALVQHLDNKALAKYAKGIYEHCQPNTIHEMSETTYDYEAFYLLLPLLIDRLKDAV